MLIPNADRAFVDLRKLADYSLSADHPVGGHKAILFERALSLTHKDAAALQEILLWVVSCVPATIGRLDEHGQRYILDFTLSARAGTASVRSAWIVRTAEDFPRLTTCYVLPA